MKKWMVSLWLVLALSSRGSWCAVQAQEVKEMRATKKTQAANEGPKGEEARGPKAPQGQVDRSNEKVLVTKGVSVVVILLLSLCVGWYWKDSKGDFDLFFYEGLPQKLRGDYPDCLPWYLAPLLCMLLYLLYEGVGVAMGYVYPATVEGQDDESHAVPRKWIQQGVHWGLMCLLSVWMGWCMQDSYGDFCLRFNHDLPRMLQGVRDMASPWYLAPLFLMPLFLLYKAVDGLVGYACAKVGRGAQDSEDNEGMEVTKRLPVQGYTKNSLSLRPLSQSL